MKKYALFILLAVMLCAAISTGCGGGSSSDSGSVEPEQTESLNENTGEDTTYDRRARNFRHSTRPVNAPFAVLHSYEWGNSHRHA